MKNTLLFLLLIFATALAYSQTIKESSAPELSKFTSAQLTACFRDNTICGTDDEILISGELASRLSSFTTDQLLACFSEWRICGADSYSLTDEIVRRSHPHLLLTRYWKEHNSSIRSGILQAVYHFHSDEVTAFMRQVLATKEGDDETMYWAANYLAKMCDRDALQWLSTRKGRSQSCMQFTGTVTLLGKCRYRPAIPYLITYSLNDACLNIVGEAEEDLRAMFPHSPTVFNNIESMQKYYCGCAKKEGFKVSCNSK
jgi:hypothetical protein